MQVYRSQGTRDVPAQRSPGFSTVQTREGPWRVFSVLTGSELVVNRRVAKELGIAVPPTLLARADRIID